MRHQSHAGSGATSAAQPADPLASALREATADTHELLGEIGRASSGAVAYLARRRATGALVALQLLPDGVAEGSAHYSVTEHRELDDAVPGPRDPCRVCQVPVPGWHRRCAVCGHEDPVVVDGSAEGTTRAELLEAVRASTAGGYELLGDICRPAGGGPVYFARELASGQLTVLRLLREDSGRPGATMAYSLLAVPLLPPAHSGQEAFAGQAPAAGGRVGVTWLFEGDQPTGGGATGGDTAAREAEPPAKVCPQCGSTYPADVMFCPSDGAALRPIAATKSLIGQIVADRFHVLAKLGEGGMGEVYLAEHVQLGRRCAVKLMRQALTDDAEATARFRREAKNASEIAHPNVATVFDFGATSEGVTYLVMEFVDGEPLSATLAREGALAPGRVATIGRQVADALAAAHALGIVHRDLKPDNVMLAVGRDGREGVKVVDFGIAKAMEGLTQQVTKTGFRIGTPAYMSPEQIRGDALDGRSDLFSLGCILFELLTGRSPFEGEGGDVITSRLLLDRTPRPRDLDATIPKPLDAIVARLLERAPEDRYASAAELAEALAAIPTDTETGGWRLPFAPRRQTRATDARPSRGITITGVEHRVPSAALRATPPIPRSPAIARPITPGSGWQGGSTATMARPARRSRRSRRTLVVASGGLLVAVAVAGVLFSHAEGRGDAAGRSAAGVGRDTSLAVAPAPDTPAPASAATITDLAGAAPPAASPPAAGTARSDVPATPPASPTPGPRAATGTPTRESPARPTATVPPAPERTATVPVSPPPPVAPPSAPAAPPEPVRTSEPAAGADATTPSPADAAAAAERADRAAVQQLIGQYMQAFDARDAAAVRRAFPGADTRALEEKRLTNWSARIVDPPVVTVRGNAAEADFSYELAFFHPETGMSRTTLAAHATLQRVADGWRIQRLEATPRR